MKKSTVILFLLFLLTGCLYYIYVRDFSSTANAIREETHQVLRVIDGDTIELENHERVRFLGINTPEKKTYLSNESLAFTKKLENKTVLIQIMDVDKYGRKLGYIFYNDRLFNEEILRNGLAHTFIYNRDKYSSSLEKAEAEAMQMEIGLWKKSENYGCLVITNFVYLDVKSSDKEELDIKNNCNKEIRILLKDSATHIYKQNFSAYESIHLETTNVWNDDGDSLYAWDEKGLMLFYRY